MKYVYWVRVLSFKEQNVWYESFYSVLAIYVDSEDYVKYFFDGVVVIGFWGRYCFQERGNPGQRDYSHGFCSII